MKRKVIQIAESTQLISLPRKWCLANNIKKGDELNVEGADSTLTVSCKPDLQIERAEVNIHNFGVLAPRMIYALYKKGADEVRINFEKPEDAQIVQTALRNETVGYEVIEQDSKGCLIKNVSGHIEGFDNMLRRTFLLLITMAEESSKALHNKDLAALKNLIVLEESNNRFTTLCRRYLNKHGAPNNQKVGPLYRILEELENIADEFKYLFTALTKEGTPELKVNKNIIDMYDTILQMLRDYHESFYKFDAKPIANIGTLRKKLVSDWYALLPKVKNPQEIMLMHHALVITQKTFNILGPMFVLNAPMSPQQA